MIIEEVKGYVLNESYGNISLPENGVRYFRKLSGNSKQRRKIIRSSSLKEVPCNPKKGEFSVKNGVYTFSENDKGRRIGIEYMYIQAEEKTTNQQTCNLKFKNF